MKIVTAKGVYDLVKGIGEGDYDGYSIYSVKLEYMQDGEERYRVDCGDAGSFEISRYEGEETYNPALDKFIYVKGEIFTFTCLSTTYIGYPLIRIEEVGRLLGL